MIRELRTEQDSVQAKLTADVDGAVEITLSFPGRSSPKMAMAFMPWMEEARVLQHIEDTGKCLIAIATQGKRDIKRHSTPRPVSPDASGDKPPRVPDHHDRKDEVPPPQGEGGDGE